jgi:hypothetical protein
MVRELLIVGLLFASPIIRNTVSSTGPGKTTSAPTGFSKYYGEINRKHDKLVPAGCYNGLFKFEMMDKSWTDDCSEVCGKMVAGVQEQLKKGRNPNSRTQTSKSESVFKVVKNKCTASEFFKVVLNESEELSQEPPQCIIAPPGPPPTTCKCIFTVNVESIFKETLTNRGLASANMGKVPVSPPKCDKDSFGKWLNGWFPDAQPLEIQQKDDPLCTAFKLVYPRRRINNNNELEMQAPNGKWVPGMKNMFGKKFPEAYASGQFGSSRDPKRQRTVLDTCPAPSQAQMARSVDFGQLFDQDTCAAPPARQSALDIFFYDNPQLTQLLPPSIAQDDGNEPSGDPLDELSKIFGSG